MRRLYMLHLTWFDSNGVNLKQKHVASGVQGQSNQNISNLQTAANPPEHREPRISDARDPFFFRQAVMIVSVC